jgi:hypothetical protein
MSEITHHTDYRQALVAIEQRIHASQTRALLAVYSGPLGPYWDIGRQLDNRLRERAWTSAVVEQMAPDLQASYPGMQLQSPTVHKIESELAALMHGDESKPNE